MKNIVIGFQAVVTDEKVAFMSQNLLIFFIRSTPYKITMGGPGREILGEILNFLDFKLVVFMFFGFCLQTWLMCQDSNLLFI